jgi:hypothetical protein
MEIDARRVAVSLLVAAGATFLSSAFFWLAGAGGVLEDAFQTVGIRLNILLFPGMVVGLIFSRGNFHGVSFAPMIIGNLVFYFGGTYYFLTLRSRARRKR